MEEIETYKQEVEKNPDDADAHNNLGIAYVNQASTKRRLSHTSRQ